MYYGNFDNEQDVVKAFEIDAIGGLVLFAAYSNENYTGEALVIFVRKGKLMLATGHHCSCYGLEGQFDPEETDLAALKRMSDAGDGMFYFYKERIKHALFVFETLDLENATPETVETILTLTANR